MISSGKFLYQLEKRSATSISKNIMADQARYIVKEKFNNKYPAVVVFCNLEIKKKIKNNYLFKYIRKNIVKNSYMIYSKIISKKYKGIDKSEGYTLVTIYSKDKISCKEYPRKVKYYGLWKIISGGQTGADQGGLFAGKYLKLYTGGVAPKNYMTETGMCMHLKHTFGLVENDNCNYNDRTTINIKESDGTIIFGNLKKSSGSKFTYSECIQNNKPIFLLGIRELNLLYSKESIDKIKIKYIKWIVENNIRILNVAGNRESKNKGMTEKVFKFLVTIISRSNLQKAKLKDYDMWEILNERNL